MKTVYIQFNFYYLLIEFVKRKINFDHRYEDYRKTFVKYANW